MLPNPLDPMTDPSFFIDLLVPYLDPTVLQNLAFTSLFLLLLGVGLELEPSAIRKALIGAPYFTVLLVNFLWVPLLSVSLVRFLNIGTASGWAMIILAVSPFAPVVPLFVRMARGNLPLAAGMTALFPLLAAFLTPVSLAMCVWLVDPMNHPQTISSFAILKLLCLSITLPLGVGLTLNQTLGEKVYWMRRFINGFAETIGACSLIALTLTEWQHLKALTITEILAMIIVYECAYFMGGYAQRANAKSRIALELGAANRNIGLAILIALQFFKEDHILAPLVGNSLLIIFLGLSHAGVSYWRWRRQ